MHSTETLVTRAGAGLPPNFEYISLGKRLEDRLRKLGVPFQTRADLLAA